MAKNKILKRSRIEYALSNIFEYPLTIVSATMGYGKTTSVRTFLECRKGNTIWVSLSGSQGIEDVFWNRFCLEIGKHYPDMAKKLAELGFPYSRQQIAAIVEYAHGYKTSQEIVVVLDDYHLIEHNQMIGILVELLVQEELHGLHIVLISRTRPNLNHVNLLSKGLCFYIDSGTLAFTLDDIDEYFHFMGFPLSRDEAAGIEKYTMGWISAIYLIMLGMKEGLKAEAYGNINQLVEENLFNLLDPQTREVILSLCIFDSFSLKQAETILENQNIRQIVKLLMDKNAFVEYDKSMDVFKIHNVLLDYLRSRHDGTTEKMKTIYRRTGLWFVSRGEYVSAFDYYHRAGKVEELLEQLSKMERVNISFLGNEMMRDICNDLPNHLCIKYPVLFLQIALNFVFSGEKSMISQSLEIMTLIRDFYGQTEGFPPGLCDKIFAELEVIDAILAFNDIKKMLVHSKEAARLFHGGESSLIFQHSEFTFGIPHFLYSYYTKPGMLKETLDCITEGFPPPFFDGCGTGCDQLALAEYALAVGDLESVEDAARKAIYKARTKNQVSIELGANFTLMRKYLMEGKIPEAKTLILNARTMLSKLDANLPSQNKRIYSTTLDLCEGFLFGCLKDSESIPEWLRDGDFSNAAYMFQGMGFPHIIYGKAILLSENWVKLEILSESFQQAFNLCHNQFGILYNSIFAAVAKYHLYGKDAGLEVLLPALKEAEKDGIVFMFAENADFLLPMLKFITEKDGIDSGYLNKLMELSNRYSKSLNEPCGKKAILTEREIEVLKLLEEGLTQKEIASQLVLSSSTVKRHLENIYQKLSVNNKIAAINSAKNLKII